jgi:lambda repressor-like predicted transcriptional regulator
MDRLSFWGHRMVGRNRIALANSAGPVALANTRAGRVLQRCGVALSNDWSSMQPGTICLPNDSLLRQTENIEELTVFAASYDGMVGNGLARLRDFLAPPRPSSSRIFRLTSYNENEPWETVDYNRVKLGTLADPAEVRQRTATKSDLQAPRRGLSVILDRDQLRDKPEWQQTHTKWLIDLLNRASVLEAVDIYTAAAIADNTTWDNASNPDLEVRTRLLTLANTTGFYPQNVAYGDLAHLARQNAYEGELTAGSLARAGLYTEQQIATGLGVSNVLINAERYQNGAVKQEIIGKNVLIFTAIKDSGPMDPSNIVRHVVGGAYGSGDYAVFVTDLGVLKVAITVINYEYLHTQHTTGIMKLAIN